MNKTRIVTINQVINTDEGTSEIEIKIHVGPCYAHVMRDGGINATTLVCQMKNGKCIPNSGYQTPTMMGFADILDMIILHTP